MTRLFITPIIGRSATTVVSSWIDIEAGLSMMYCRSMPPDFWAAAGLPTSPKIAIPTAAPKMPRFAVIARFLPAGPRGIGPVLPAGRTIARRSCHVPGGRQRAPIICPLGDCLVLQLSLRTEGLYRWDL